MVRVAPLVALSLAGSVIATPTGPKSGGNDLLCGGLLQPLAGFLDFQAGNVGGNVENILGAAEDIVSGTPKDIKTILESVVGGVVGSLTNGVTNILYGLSTAVDAVDPECRKNAALCLNELHAAAGACASGQKSQARDACLQSKYTCVRDGNLSTDQINKIASCCSQYTSAPA